MTQTSDQAPAGFAGIALVGLFVICGIYLLVLLFFGIDLFHLIIDGIIQIGNQL